MVVTIPTRETSRLFIIPFFPPCIPTHAYRYNAKPHCFVVFSGAFPVFQRAASSRHYIGTRNPCRIIGYDAAAECVSSRWGHAASRSGAVLTGGDGVESRLQGSGGQEMYRKRGRTDLGPGREIGEERKNNNLVISKPLGTLSAVCCSPAFPAFGSPSPPIVL